jgi:8-oxo-dGTP pyrophosphatase MutT (NUDIX family)
MSRPQRRQQTAQIHLRRGAKALVTTTDRVLLIKERHEDGSPFWTLPGGGIEHGESPPGTLRRELHEELCCATAITERCGRFWYAHHGTDTLTRYVVFECALLSRPTPNRADGVVDARWARTDDLPPETLLPVRHLLTAGPCPTDYTNESK